jgi:hypothetical protein
LRRRWVAFERRDVEPLARGVDQREQAQQCRIALLDQRVNLAPELVRTVALYGEHGFELFLRGQAREVMHDWYQGVRDPILVIQGDLEERRCELSVPWRRLQRRGLQRTRRHRRTRLASLARLRVRFAQLLRFGELSSCLEEIGEIRPRLDGAYVVRACDPCPDIDDSAVELAGLLVAPLHQADAREIHQGSGDRRVILAVHFFAQCERTLRELLGASEVVAIEIKEGKARRQLGDVGMLGAEDRLRGRQRLLERFRCTFEITVAQKRVGVVYRVAESRVERGGGRGQQDRPAKKRNGEESSHATRRRRRRNGSRDDARKHLVLAENHSPPLSRTRA